MVKMWPSFIVLLGMKLLIRFFFWFSRYFTNSENLSEPQFQFSSRPAGGSKNPIWRHMIITTIFNIDLEGHGCRVRFEE